MHANLLHFPPYPVDVLVSSVDESELYHVASQGIKHRHLSIRTRYSNKSQRLVPYAVYIIHPFRSIEEHD